MMKKTVCLLLTLMFALTLTACGSQTEKTDSETPGEKTTVRESTESSPVEEDPDANVSPIYKQDPFAVIPGNYTAADGKATATVTSPAVDTLAFEITKNDGSLGRVVWTLSGILDDALSLTFQNASMKEITYNESGEIAKEEIKYTDGSGTVVFDREALRFTWEDAKSGQGALVFTFDENQS